jgi:amino acid transporter
LVGRGVGNALAFARFVTIASLPGYSKGQDLDSKVIKLVAVNIISVVCLIHYSSTRLGLFLNRLLALYKLCLIVAVFGAGFWAADAQYAGLGRDPKQPPRPSTISRLGAFVLVIYSYTGWENANYVYCPVVVTLGLD